jgi:hypothetical protein
LIQVLQIFHDGLKINPEPFQPEWAGCLRCVSTAIGILSIRLVAWTLTRQAQIE